MHEHQADNFKALLDPLGKWPEANLQNIMDMCGFIPGWFKDYADRHDTDPAPVPVKDWLTECYGFGELHPMGQGVEGSTIDKSGMHSYPGDPDMYPILLLYAKNGAQVMQYEHGIVAMRDSNKEPWFLTRMD